MSDSYYYHYSTASNIASMLDTGRINESVSPTDTMMGNGVYLTTKPPQTGDAKLGQNNYDGAKRGDHDPRLEAFIRIPKDQLEGVVCQKDGRNVCVHPGSIDLADVDVLAGVRKRYGQ